MKRFNQKRDRKNERGQILILLAFVMFGLLLMSALAVDVGFAYVTKARLAKAVDAACLTGMKNLAQGTATAQTLAISSFNANYPITGLDANAPTVSVGFTTNSGQEYINVSASATIRTIFMGLLPGRRTLTITNSAQALRGILVMTMILDRSGSMSSNGGSAALPPAATTFVNYFDNYNDRVALTSFASNATTDVTMQYQFQTPITNAINALNFNGGTFGLGGLVLAKTQEDSVVVQNGQNIVKVVVYFTDGLVNTIQDTLPCTSSWGNTLYNFGGYDTGSSVDFFKPTDGTDWGGLTGNPAVPPHVPTPNCTGVTYFTSQIDGSHKSFTRTNVTADAQYRSLAVANALRAEGVYVYSIGLGSSPSQSFLKQIANDPGSSTYDSTQPVGMAVFAPDCPSSQCTQELQQVFQTIASRILLRLTQ